MYFQNYILGATFRYRHYEYKLSHVDIVGCEIYRFSELTQNMAIRPTTMKVIQDHPNFGTSRKPLCDFLLVNQTNLTSCLAPVQSLVEY